MDVTTARALLTSDPDTLVVDVRSPAEFEAAHIEGAINLPLDQVDAHLSRIVSGAGGKLLLVCQSGNRAATAGRRLAGAGLRDVTVLDGGMGAWISAGAPVRRGRQRWGLERQVRLVAGALVLAAVIVSVWLPPARYVAGVVGAGLLFAGMSNVCMMGSLLARLPFNRGAGCDVDSAIDRLRGAA